MKLPLAEKLEKSKEVVSEALDRFERTAIAYTGGKDSTLMLWIIREVCLDWGKNVPELMFIDEGCVFEEVLSFAKDVAKNWNLKLNIIRNEDVMKQVTKVGDKVKVKLLSEVNRRELVRLGFNGEEFTFEPESYICNHLMKTVTMNNFIVERNLEAVFTGIRWDEQEARRDELYFSPREDPKHTRIHPILHFKERDVWDAIKKYNIPTNKLYAEGYRSLGAKGTTTKISDIPAWEQDLDNTVERAGRRQDKEKIMKRLRELGYM